MTETPHYRVEYPTMSGLQSYLNLSHESGYEVVSCSAVDSTSDQATLVLKTIPPEDEVDRLWHLLRWVRMLPGDVDEEPAGMVKLVRHMLRDMDEIAATLEKM